MQLDLSAEARSGEVCPMENGADLDAHEKPLSVLTGVLREACDQAEDFAALLDLYGRQAAIEAIAEMPLTQKLSPEEAEEVFAETPQGKAFRALSSLHAKHVQNLAAILDQVEAKVG